MKGFRARDARIFRPYRDEIPWELLASARADEKALAAVVELDLMRVAKHQGQVVGVYGIRPQTPIRYELVVLAVAEGYRRKGLGRWLLGHAIGLAESKGAREIFVRGQAHGRFLAPVGFAPDGPDQLLTLTPE